MAEISKLTVPVDVSGTVTNVTYDIKDATARQMISELGHCLYWMGVTTTALTDGDTTNPITIGGDSVTAGIGGVAQYNSVEFVWNGSAWQMLGEGNLGALAFKDSASGSYTPAGTVTVSSNSDASTTSIAPVSSVGTLPTFQYTSGTETLVFTAGTLPTLGTAQNVLTSVGTFTGSFAGTADTITVS